MSFGATASRRRQAAGKHAERTRTCSECGRTIRGNAWYGHRDKHRRDWKRLMGSERHVALWAAINAFADARSIPGKEGTVVLVEKELMRLLCWWETGRRGT